MENKPRYTCVNCGFQASELYRTYTPTVLKLTKCKNCHEITDKYIEYDPIIIIIDLVLLRKEAYRHFLYNTDFKHHWKIGILIQLMETYTEWTLMFGDKVQAKEMLDNSIVQQKDLLFYVMFLKVVSGTLMYIFTLHMVTMLMSRVFKKSLEAVDIIVTLKIFTISNFGKFLLLPAIIWSDYTAEYLNMLLAHVYTTICQFLVYSVVCKCSMVFAVAVVLMANMSKIVTMQVFSAVYLSVFSQVI